MKKLALLFLILCAGALNGMKHLEQKQLYDNLPEQKQFLLYGNLPQELRELIISSIGAYDNLEVIINTIKTARFANKEIHG